MKKVYLYIHGKGGDAGEAEIFRGVLDGDIVGIDYDCYEPWFVKGVILKKYDEVSPDYDEVNIIANSIGAYFGMLALGSRDVGRAFFISPVVDMERLILDMMAEDNVSENELKLKGEIATTFGEVLSWKYLCYVRDNLVSWKPQTYILYGENDKLINISTVQDFAKKHSATLTIMEGGEHWFHTKEQIDFLLKWIKKYI